MSKIFLVCPMNDQQTGMYIHDSLIKLGHKVAFFDWRHITEQIGPEKMNIEFLSAITQLKPELTIIVKGLGITGETIQKARGIFNHPIVGWIFDVTLGGTYVKDAPIYIDLIKEFDKFYTVDNSAVPELKNLGVNAEWLPEGCFVKSHKEVVYNSIQAKKYGADIVFMGGIDKLHPNRNKFLERLHEEGYLFKIYGAVNYEKGKEPEWVKDHHTGFSAINDYHSIACNASKIVLGIDGIPERDKAFSARLYRVLCAGGFYLNTATKGLDKVFKVGEHLETFKDEEELMEKIDKYLNDDDARERIAKAGQKEVLEKHQFEHRLKKIIDEMPTKPKDLNSSNTIQ